jgi:hypothetical protein
MDSIQRIGRIVAMQQRGDRAPAPVPDAAPEPRASHALVRFAPAPREPEPTDWGRPAAAFLAQLIASQENLPQTRARRRAAPREAIAAYQAAAARR